MRLPYAKLAALEGQCRGGLSTRHKLFIFDIIRHREIYVKLRFPDSGNPCASDP